MAWTDPRTWVVGETLTAALLNTHLRDNLRAGSRALTISPTSNRVGSAVTAEAELYSFQIPASGIGLNGGIRMRLYGQFGATGVDKLFIRARGNGSVEYMSMQFSSVQNQERAFEMDLAIFARGASGTRYIYGRIAAFDRSADLNIGRYDATWNSFATTTGVVSTIAITAQFEGSGALNYCERHLAYTELYGT